MEHDPYFLKDGGARVADDWNPDNFVGGRTGFQTGILDANWGWDGCSAAPGDNPPWLEKPADGVYCWADDWGAWLNWR